MTRQRIGWLTTCGLCLLASVPVLGQTAALTTGIQDNSFTVEEAYNQAPGEVQHINTFLRTWNSNDWTYSFTEEWPVPHHWRHQLSYSLTGVHSGGFTGAGWGDTALHYRYQVLGDEESRLAFAPRVSVLLPTGDVTRGRGEGGVGVQVNLPVSIVLHRRLVSHWNAGSTFVPHAQSPDHFQAATVGYNLGQSFVVIVHPRVNFLVETTSSRFQSVVGPGETRWSTVTYVSPGIRWAYNLKHGLQIVPGVAEPIGVGASAGEKGIFIYLSFEHPFERLNSK